MRSVRGRLARLLLTLAKETDCDELPRLLTQEEMASQLGTVREVVGRGEWWKSRVDEILYMKGVPWKSAFGQLPPVESEDEELQGVSQCGDAT